MNPSLITKHSIIIKNRKTSVSMEQRFWISLRAIADRKGITMHHLVTEIDGKREHRNLSSAIRLYVLDDAEQRAVAMVPVMETEVPVLRI